MDKDEAINQLDEWEMFNLIHEIKERLQETVLKSKGDRKGTTTVYIDNQNNSRELPDMESPLFPIILDKEIGKIAKAMKDAVGKYGRTSTKPIK